MWRCQLIRLVQLRWFRPHEEPPTALLPLWIRSWFTSCSDGRFGWEIDHLIIHRNKRVSQRFLCPLGSGGSRGTFAAHRQRKRAKSDLKHSTFKTRCVRNRRERAFEGLRWGGSHIVGDNGAKCGQSHPWDFPDPKQNHNGSTLVSSEQPSPRNVS